MLLWPLLVLLYFDFTTILWSYRRCEESFLNPVSKLKFAAEDKSKFLTCDLLPVLAYVRPNFPANFR